MSRYFVLRGKLIVSAMLIALLSVSGFSQVSLREALDFDGDGLTDFSVFRRATGFWYVNGTTGTFIGQQWGNADEDRLVPGDYDGDNRADIAVWRDTTGTFHVLRSSDFTYAGTQWGTSGDVPVARDYDNDGKTDPAVVRRSGGVMTWYVLKSTGGFIGLQWGADTDFPVPGDYDGDGSFDFAVQRPGPTPTSQANFYIFATTAGFIAVPWGASDDFAAPGDYDGDGKTDIAIVREGATGADALLWAILRSDGQGYYFAAFGRTADDYIAQGYYDNDNRTDIAVWRQPTGDFFVLNSTTGSLAGGQWGGSGDVPVAAYSTY